MQISGVSTTSTAVQQLEALIAGLQGGATTSGSAAFSAGQSLPPGNVSASVPAAPTTPAQSKPSNQFASDVLSFLTSLQDVVTGVAGAAATAAMGSSPIGMAVGVGVQDLASVLGDIGKASKQA